MRTETSPEDVGGMHAATGILTARGGMTSHAAVVARGWGKCCVSGCADIRVNDDEKVHFFEWVNYEYGVDFYSSKRVNYSSFSVVQFVLIGDKVINEGEWLSLNGSTGEVILGKQPLSPPALSSDLETFMSWADKLRRLKVLGHLFHTSCVWNLLFRVQN